MNKVGAAVVEVLERAGTQYLRQDEPDLYQAYLLNVGAAQALRRYDGTECYWDRVQAILDAFFSSSERARSARSSSRSARSGTCPSSAGF